MPALIISVSFHQGSGHFSLRNPGFSIFGSENYSHGLAYDFGLIPPENPARTLIPGDHAGVEIQGYNGIFDSALKDCFEKTFPGATGTGNRVHHLILRLILPDAQAELTLPQSRTDAIAI
ncbi:hypothetical protein RLPCCGM1_p0022 [Rhizobium leguminosarum bv. phaseoli CCGM1]|nr:hypothetical protein RLPCCGM1_p0022 [Rhizobium leguminosarum bv. phaseoli CCGM1]